MRYLALAILLLSATAHARPVKDAAENAGDPQDKMICKRFIETGSLVQGYRTCKTKRDWDRERDNLRTLATGDSCGTRGNGIPCEPIGH